MNSAAGDPDLEFDASPLNREMACSTFEKDDIDITYLADSVSEKRPDETVTSGVPGGCPDYSPVNAVASLHTYEYGSKGASSLEKEKTEPSFAGYHEHKNPKGKIPLSPFPGRLSARASHLGIKHFSEKHRALSSAISGALNAPILDTIITDTHDGNVTSTTNPTDRQNHSPIPPVNALRTR